MLHYAYPDLVVYLEHMNRYSGEIAQLLPPKAKPAARSPPSSGTAVLNPCGDLRLQLLLPLGLPRRPRRPPASPQPLRLHPLEVHQGLVARAGQVDQVKTVSCSLSRPAFANGDQVNLLRCKAILCRSTSNRAVTAPKTKPPMCARYATPPDCTFATAPA